MPRGRYLLDMRPINGRAISVAHLSPRQYLLGMGNSRGDRVAPTTDTGHVDSLILYTYGFWIRVTHRAHTGAKGAV